MNEEEIRRRSQQFIEEERLGYQAIALPGGVTTPGHERDYLHETLFGSDFTGKTFLDIGSYLGAFCLEAMRRGADEALGIETDPTNIRQARKIAELWGLDASYVQADFEDWPLPDRQFDVVACLNVLHHLYDPIHALRRMMSLARSRLVLEVAVPTWRDVGRDMINPLRVFGVGAPALFLGIPHKRGDAAGRTFLFTPQSLKILFGVHTSMFEPITISRSPFKGRIVVEAVKRSIGHLVVVAGPTSVGKSTLVERLAKDPAFAAGFGLDPGPWTVTHAATVRKLPRGRHEHLLFHYDFLRPSRSGMRSHDRDPVLQLLAVAERVTILTLIAPRNRLGQQLEQGEIGRKDRKVRQRDLDLRRHYAAGSFLLDWYSGWMDFCSRHAGARHHLIVNEGEFALHPPEIWRQVLETGLRGTP